MANNPTGVTVIFATDPLKAAPDPAVVNRGHQDGVQWTANLAGYTFTALEIGDTVVGSGGVGDFHDVEIDQNPAGNSRLTVDDDCTIPAGAVSVDYKYTLHYKEPGGVEKSLDPTVRNRR